MKSFRTIARIVGILFLAGMIIGVVGNIIVQSVFSQQDYLRFNALLISGAYATIKR